MFLVYWGLLHPAWKSISSTVCHTFDLVMECMHLLKCGRLCTLPANTTHLASSYMLSTHTVVYDFWHVAMHVEMHDTTRLMSA